MKSNDLTQLFSFYKWHEIVKSLLFAKVIGFIILLPFFALTFNLMLIYIRFLYMFLLILSGLFSLYFSLVIYITLLTVANYHDEKPLDPKSFTWHYGVPTSIAVFFICALAIILLTPYFI